MLICTAFCFTGAIMAQQSQIKKANQKFKDLAYIDAISIYENVANKGYVDAGLYQKIGDAYYFNADYDKAAVWYGKLFDLQQTNDLVYNFRYGQSLKASGNYKKADQYLGSFFKAQGLNYQNSDIYLNDIEKNASKYIVNTSKHSTKYSDYPAFYRSDTLYVTTADLAGELSPWNNEPTSNVYRTENTELKALQPDINTKFNEGSIAITKKGDAIYFTRNDYTNKKLGKDKNRITRLKLYRIRKADSLWTDEEELPFSNRHYSVGHPALSPDNKTLYFVSDMPGNDGKGGTDIYKVTINDDGTFGTATNLASLNTFGDEMFPFVANDGTLYFSSDGQTSNLGGLDVYSASLNQDGSYGSVENLGRPINSPTDDFAFVINDKTEEGFLSSNRYGAVSDDIYAFSKNENYKAPCNLKLKGVVRNKETGEVLKDVLITLVGPNNTPKDQKLFESGLYDYNNVDCNEVKFIRAEKSGYLTNEEIINATDGIFNKDILLDPRVINTDVGSDIGKYLNPIYFDLDKHNIRPDAQIELQKLVQILLEKPSIKIDVRSHTDSRANDAYNMALSNRRAKSVIDYLLKSGINRNRLTGRGYGESQLVNGCSNGVECMEASHQENRRSEFIIIK